MYKIDKIKKENRRINRIKKFVNIVVYIIIIPIILINCAMIIESFMNPNETPSIFGFKMFSIVSGSMEPTIKVGDLIVVKEVEQDEIKENDIISFENSGSITTHRVKSIVDDNGVKKYLTKGDNNNVEDKDKVAFEKVEGKYLIKIDGVGYLINALKSPITLIVLVTVLILNYYYRQRLLEKKLLRKEIRKRYKERQQLNEEENRKE